jgi:amino acid adenylation domain-containing protein
VSRLRPDRPAGFVPFLPAEVEQSVASRFEAQVARQGDRRALTDRLGRYSYAELNRQANEIAHAVLDRRGPAEECVAMLVEPGARPVGVALGIWKAGKTLVALDPSHPVAHNRTILREVGASLVLTDRPRAPEARAVADGVADVLDVETRRPGPADAREPGLVVSPDALAQVLFTSGSTGGHKGVMWTHRTLLHFSRRTTNDLFIHAGDRHSALRSVAFGGWTLDLAFSLLNGTSLHCYDPRTEGLHALGDWLEAEEITLYRSAASVFRTFASLLGGRDRCPRLRVSVVTAEPVHPREVELFTRHFSDAGWLCNELGLTEAGTVRSYFVDRGSGLPGDRVPVGYPVDDVDVVLLDAQGRMVEPGEVGEIVVRSRFLASGYWQAPELTAERFRPDPDGLAERMYFSRDLGTMDRDGCLVHHGRRDFQVKVRGHLVSVEQVEAELVSVPGVSTAAVTARADTHGETQLVAYVVPGDGTLAVDAVRAALARRIPEHMIPAVFVPLSAMPLTPGGKVDRQALPAPTSARAALATAFVAPRTPLETWLCAIWAEVLDLDTVGIQDDFLELGGDSLQAGRIVARILDLLPASPTVGDLLAAPTVEAMASLLASDRG